MANEKNLIPNSERTPSERRENASKAGKASGVARRKKRTMKNVLEMLLSMPTKSADDYDFLLDQGIDLLELDDEVVDNIFVINAALLAKAKKGDLEAIRMVLQIIGQDHYKNEKIKLEKKEIDLKKKQVDNECW